MRSILMFVAALFSSTLLLAQQPTLQEQARAILMQGAHINHFNRQFAQERYTCTSTIPPTSRARPYGSAPPCSMPPPAM